jgi:hypothetical protein
MKLAKKEITSCLSINCSEVKEESIKSKETMLYRHQEMKEANDKSFLFFM